MSDFYSPQSSLYSDSLYGRSTGFYASSPANRKSLEQKIFGAESQAKAYGIKIPDQKKKVRLWDLLEWARYPITNMIYTSVKEAKEERLAFDDIGKILKSAWYGVTLKEKHNTEDYLALLYPEAPKWVLTVAGLAGDIVTDPLTWLTFGTAGGIKGAAKAGAQGAKYSQKLIKRFAQEGVKSAFVKKAIAKYGGKTWQEATQLAARSYARKAGQHGLRLGIPFTGAGKKLIAGGPLDWAEKGLRAGGAENLAKAVQRAPAAIRQLPGIAGIRRAFSTSAKWGHFPEAHDVERMAVRAAGHRVEVSLDNFKQVARGVKNLIDNPTPGTLRIVDALGKQKGLDATDAILEYVWRHNELLATGKGVYGTPAAAVHIRTQGLKVPRQITGLTPLPEELTMLDDQLRVMLNDIWGEFTSRGMTKKVKYLEAYYPRFAKDPQGNIAVIMRRELSSDATFLHTRVFATRIQAEKAGFKLMSPSDSLVQYGQRASNSLMNHDLVKEMVDTYGTVAKKAPGFTRVKVDGFKEYVLPPDIADVINKTEKLLLDPDEATKALDFMNGLQNRWKKMATIFNPGFHGRNFLSNTWTMAYKDGMGPRQLNNFGKAIQIHTWRKHPEQIIEITLDGKKVGKSANELYEMMRKVGAHTGGFEAAELMPTLAKTGGPLTRAGSMAGSAIENTARVASVLNDLDKGLTLAQATKRVNHFFLDYGDYTKVEAKLKKVIPFYMWLKNNAAVQVGEFIQNPGKYSMMTIKPLRAMDWLPGEEAEYLPDWMERELYVNPLGAQGAGGSPLMLNPNLPFQDIGKLGPTLTHPLSPQSAVLEGLTPFIKTPFELALNTSAFTGQPLQYHDYDYRPAPPAIRIVMDRFPPEIKERLGIKSDELGNMIMPGKWVHALTSFIPLLKVGGSVERLVQTMTGAGLPEYRQERAPWDVLSRTAGVKFRPYDVEYYKEKALQERLKQLKGLTSLTGATTP